MAIFLYSRTSLIRASKLRTSWSNGQVSSAIFAQPCSKKGLGTRLIFVHMVTIIKNGCQKVLAECAIQVTNRKIVSLQLVKYPLRWKSTRNSACFHLNARSYMRTCNCMRITRSYLHVRVNCA